MLYTFIVYRNIYNFYKRSIMELCKPIRPYMDEENHIYSLMLQCLVFFPRVF